VREKPPYVFKRLGLRGGGTWWSERGTRQQESGAKQSTKRKEKKGSVKKTVADHTLKYVRLLPVEKKKRRWGGEGITQGLEGIWVGGGNRIEGRKQKRQEKKREEIR